MSVSSARKLLIEKRFINNRRLNSTEELIMDNMRNGIDPTDLIYYREQLRSRLHDIQEQINDLV